MFEALPSNYTSDRIPAKSSGTGMDIRSFRPASPLQSIQLRENIENPSIKQGVRRI